MTCQIASSQVQASSKMIAFCTTSRSGPEVIKLFMLNSAEHEIHPAHKCKNANNCWHFNISILIQHPRDLIFGILVFVNSWNFVLFELSMKKNYNLGTRSHTARRLEQTGILEEGMGTGLPLRQMQRRQNIKVQVADRHGQIHVYYNDADYTST